MPTNFQGRKRSAVLPARLASLKLATPGVPFTNASGQFGSVDLGLRKPAKYSITPVNVTEVLDREIPDMYECALQAESYQNSFSDLLNAYLLCCARSASDAGVQVLAKDMAGRLWGHVAQTGTPLSPVGTQLMGMNFEGVINSKDRYITYDGKVQLTGAELQVLQTQTAGPITGGAGTTTLPFAASGYSRTRHQRFGIDSIVVAGHDVGILDTSFAFSMKSKQIAKANANRELVICNFVEFSIKAGLLQSSLTELNALLDNAEAGDVESLINLLSGEIIDIKNGALLPKIVRELGEDGIVNSIEWKGSLVSNSDEATPGSIDIGVTTPGTMVLNQLGYDGTI